MASLSVACDICGNLGWNNCEPDHYRCRSCRMWAPKPQVVRKHQSVVLGRRGTELERFEIKVHRNEFGCWLWIGALNRSGYGLFNKTKAHRFAYQMFVGPIEDGMHIDHLCRVRNCVNPSHLEAVTISENNRRAWEARRAKTA